MTLGRVVGNVVSTQKNAKLEGAKLLLVQPLDLGARRVPLRRPGGLADRGSSLRERSRARPVRLVSTRSSVARSAGVRISTSACS